MKRTILLSILLLCLDICSKQLVVHFMDVGQSISIIPRFFSLTYVKNRGIAFSMLEGNLVFIIFLSLLIIGGIFFSIRFKKLSWSESFCYALIVGGAIGNLIDRVIYGYVIDFFDFTLFGYEMAIFNVADIFIVLGVFLLLFMEFWKGRDKRCM